jgi:hypothetical protein
VRAQWVGRRRWGERRNKDDRLGNNAARPLCVLRYLPLIDIGVMSRGEQEENEVKRQGQREREKAIGYLWWSMICAGTTAPLLSKSVFAIVTPARVDVIFQKALFT